MPNKKTMVRSAYHGRKTSSHHMGAGFEARHPDITHGIFDITALMPRQETIPWYHRFNRFPGPICHSDMGTTS